MGLFKKERLRRKAYRKKTEDDLNKALDRRKKEWAFDQLLEQGKTNPDIVNEAIANLMGIRIKEPDPSKKQKDAIEKLTHERALEIIEGDPDLKDEFARAQIPKILGHRYKHESGSEGFVGGGIEDVITQYRSLKDEFGGGGDSSGLVGSILNSEFGKQLGAAVGQLLGKQQGVPGQKERTILVQYNGELTEVTEEEYNQLTVKGLLKPVAVLEPPKQSPVTPEALKPQSESKEQYTTTQETVELPDFISLFDLNQILGYMEETPEDFVIQLKYEVQSGIESSIFIWNVLSTMTYDNIAVMVTQYKDDAQVGYAATKILENKEWMEKAITLVKEGLENE